MMSFTTKCVLPIELPSEFIHANNHHVQMMRMWSEWERKKKEKNFELDKKEFA